VTGRAFADAFARFARWAAGDYPAQLTPLRTVAPGARSNGSVAPFAIHYLRLRVPRRDRFAVIVSLPTASASVRAALTYQLESMIAGNPSLPGRILPRVSKDGRTLTFTIPRRLRESERFAYPTLVVSNGSATRPASYSLSVR
jgi:hypothetical protein